MKKEYRFFLIIFSVLSWVHLSCMTMDNDPGQEITLGIAPYKIPCYFGYQTLCYHVDENGGTNYTNIYENDLSGLNFSWGHEYQAKVLKKELNPRPTDSSGYTYTLKQITKDNVISPGYTFDFSVSGIYITKGANAGEYWLLDNKNMICPDINVCNSLDTSMATGNWFNMSLKFGNPVTGPLEIISVY